MPSINVEESSDNSTRFFARLGPLDLMDVGVLFVNFVEPPKDEIGSFFIDFKVVKDITFVAIVPLDFAVVNDLICFVVSFKGPPKPVRHLRHKSSISD